MKINVVIGSMGSSSNYIRVVLSPHVFYFFMIEMVLRFWRQFSNRQLRCFINHGNNVQYKNIGLVAIEGCKRMVAFSFSAMRFRFS